jgi:hypothetical protein
VKFRRRRSAFELFDFFDLFSQETEDFRGVFDFPKLIKRARGSAA